MDWNPSPQLTTWGPTTTRSYYRGFFNWLDRASLIIQILIKKLFLASLKKLNNSKNYKTEYQTITYINGIIKTLPKIAKKTQHIWQIMILCYRTGLKGSSVSYSREEQVLPVHENVWTSKAVLFLGKWKVWPWIFLY